MAVEVREPAQDQSAAAALCPVCEVKTTALLRTPPPEEGESRRSATFFICPSCGLRFQDATEGQDGSIFAEVEYARELQDKGPRRAPKPWWKYYDENVLQRFEQLAPGKRLLDIGSGDGRFLRAARERGFDAAGADISPVLAEEAERTSGAPVHVGWLPDLSLPGGSFDAANLDLVIMYVPDPLALMREVSRLLSPGGIVRVREFVNDSINARRAGTRWWPYADTTLRVYSRRSLSLLAERSGLVPARKFSGTDASYELWRAQWLLRGPLPKLTSLPSYWVKQAHLFGIPLAGDSIWYLQKPPA